MSDFGIIILSILGVVTSLVVGCSAYQDYQCDQYAEITGVETRYSYGDICYISTPNGWQRWDEYLERNKGVDSAKEIFK